jgi:hypothetical protein
MTSLTRDFTKADRHAILVRGPGVSTPGYRLVRGNNGSAVDVAFLPFPNAQFQSDVVVFEKATCAVLRRARRWIESGEIIPVSELEM